MVRSLHNVGLVMVQSQHSGFGTVSMVRLRRHQVWWSRLIPRAVEVLAGRDVVLQTQPKVTDITGTTTTTIY